MKNYKFLYTIFLICAVFFVVVPIANAVEEYTIDKKKMLELRNFMDDKTPYPDYYKILLPPAVYKRYTYDIEKMKKLMQEVVGFKSTDLVGKIAPEITPGKYTYQDKASKPGLKQLMLPIMYENFFRKAGPPLGATFSEFEVVPTQQLYYSVPHLEATLKNRGKVKTDAEGFIQWETFTSGIPFPKPSGPEKMKALQIIYNFLYQYLGADQMIANNCGLSWDKNFKQMSYALADGTLMRLAGRVTDPPFGWYDERAKKLGEYRVSTSAMLKPRDVYGNVSMAIVTLDPNKPNQLYAYSSALRRVRKMTGTDAQDTAMGVNTIYDDAGGFSRKLSPTIFPYEYKILAEREYLVPEYIIPGSTIYFSSQDLEIRNMKMVRRPLYVIELTQKDPTYVYGRTVLYIDKESFDLYMVENYDQKNRLFRVLGIITAFHPETTIRTPSFNPNWNMQVQQTAIGFVTPQIPARLTRDNYSISALQRFLK